MFKDMEQWTEIRRRVLTGEISKRAACREYKLDWKILKRVLEHEEPTEYRLKQPRPKPKLQRFLPIIHEILKRDEKAPKKQRHTAKRIFERLRKEHHYDGGLAVEACGRGKRVRFWKVTELITHLIEAREERQLARMKSQLAKLDLLVLDELGYVPTSKLGRSCCSTW